MYLLKKKKVLEIFRAALVLISLNIFKVKQIYTEPSLSATHVFAYQENIPFPLAILCKPNNAISIPKTFSVLHSAPQCKCIPPIKQTIKKTIKNEENSVRCTTTKRVRQIIKSPAVREAITSAICHLPSAT